MGSITQVRSRLPFTTQSLTRQQVFALGLPLSRRSSDLGLHTCAAHHQIFLLGDSIFPMLVIVLINPCESAALVDLDDHTDMAFKILPRGLDSNIAIWSDQVIGMAADPNLFENCTCRRRYDGLGGDWSVHDSLVTTTRGKSQHTLISTSKGWLHQVKPCCNPITALCPTRLIRKG